MKIYSVTTMSAQGWRDYGRRMVESYLERWPSDIPLILYAEGFRCPDGITGRELPQWQADFKERHKNNPDAHGVGERKPFRRQAVRFSHKVGAICDAAERLAGQDAWLIWLDADTFTHSEVTKRWLKSLVEYPFMIALLQRRKHSECGFMIFNMAHPQTQEFFNRLRSLYETDMLFDYKETHDSYLIDRVIEEMQGDEVLAADHVCNLSGPSNDHGHVFVKSKLAECMDHRKGNLKALPHTFLSKVNPKYRHKFKAIKS